MLQVQKPVILHKKTVTSVKRNEFSALEIKTLGYNESLRMSCVTCTQSEMLLNKEANGDKAKKIAPKIFLSHRITWPCY